MSLLSTFRIQMWIMDETRETFCKPVICDWRPAVMWRKTVDEKISARKIPRSVPVTCDINYDIVNQYLFIQYKNNDWIIRRSV